MTNAGTNAGPWHRSEALDTLVECQVEEIDVREELSYCSPIPLKQA